MNSQADVFKHLFVRLTVGFETEDIANPAIWKRIQADRGLLLREFDEVTAPTFDEGQVFKWALSPPPPIQPRDRPLQRTFAAEALGAMNKLALQRHAAAMRDGIADALQTARNDHGRCRLCEAPVGRAAPSSMSALIARSEYGFEAEQGTASAYFWTDRSECMQQNETSRAFGAQPDRTTVQRPRGYRDRLQEHEGPPLR